MKFALQKVDVEGVYVMLMEKYSSKLVSVFLANFKLVTKFYITDFPFFINSCENM